MRKCAAAILILTAALATLAATPATQPTTLPDTGPRLTFKTFMGALTFGNPEKIGDLCSADDAKSRQVVRDFQDVARSIKAIRDAATFKFGAQAADSVLPAMPALGDVDDAKETIDGDKAVLDGGGLMGPVHLARTSGQWKLDIAELMRQGDLPPNTHAYLEDLAKAVRRTADDIRNGKLSSVDVAQEVLQIRQAQINDDLTATEPSTEPTTDPS
jgi:hypothetical protein